MSKNHVNSLMGTAVSAGAGGLGTLLTGNPDMLYNSLIVGSSFDIARNAPALLLMAKDSLRQPIAREVDNGYLEEIIEAAKKQHGIAGKHTYSEVKIPQTGTTAFNSGYFSQLLVLVEDPVKGNQYIELFYKQSKENDSEKAAEVAQGLHEMNRFYGLDFSFIPQRILPKERKWIKN